MARRVIVVVDLQNDYFPGGKLPLWNVDTASGNAARVIARAREEGTPVVHIRHEFPGPDAPFFVANTDGARIHASVLPLADERVILKHYPNSFRDTDLREVLDGHGPQEVFILGAMTHMCIDATARAAADFGYNVLVLHDACATLDVTFGEHVVAAPQVQAAFLGALANGYARLQSADDFLAAKTLDRAETP
ncbi:isochorismatase hydrolase [Novosphingobium sp. Rr 2-17]|nr:isochorismatase hydrolase [Novosphingobium sp. Rr 2-17]